MAALKKAESIGICTGYKGYGPEAGQNRNNVGLS
jgi:hypothetical protein